MYAAESANGWCNPAGEPITKLEELTGYHEVAWIHFPATLRATEQRTGRRSGLTAAVPKKTSC
jgi:hypothetical protein